MVKSEKIYSPQEYLYAVTGICYCINGDNDVEGIEDLLEQKDLSLWSYPLSEIDHIVENKIDAVLVDCLVWNEDLDKFEHVFRWFEVPEDFSEEK